MGGEAMDPKQGKNGRRKHQHVVIIPLLNSGHLPPLVQLLYVLDSRSPGIIVTITASPKFAAELAELQKNGDLLNIDLRVEPVPGIIPRDSVTYRAFGYCFSDQNYLETQGLRERLIALKGNPDAPTSLIGDMFFYWCKDLAEELGGIPWYTFWSCYPVYTLLVVQHDELVKAQLGERAISNPGELLSVAAPVFQNVPGTAALHLADMPDEEFFECSDYTSKIAKNMRCAAGILVNAAEEMDEPGGAINAMKEILGEDRIFAIGPAIQMEGFGRIYSPVPTHEVLPWLDKQHENSVLYLAFGSTVVSSKERIHEVAAALEATGVPFLWAVKLHPGSSEGLLDLLPERFQERTAGRGLVLTGWLPQIKILQHSAVGAFVTHCGFNSTLETVCAGVPVIGWPSGADQLMIVRYVTQHTKTGVSIASFKPHDQYSFKDITRKEIETAIRTVMLENEGLELRANAQKLQKAVVEVAQKGGSSYRNLDRLVDLL